MGIARVKLSVREKEQRTAQSEAFVHFFFLFFFFFFVFFFFFFDRQ